MHLADGLFWLDGMDKTGPSISWAQVGVNPPCSFLADLNGPFVYLRILSCRAGLNACSVEAPALMRLFPLVICLYCGNLQAAWVTIGSWVQPLPLGTGTEDWPTLGLHEE